jgi:hypothetical protein
VARPGRLIGMSVTDNIHASPAEVGADVVEATGVGLRLAEVAVVIFFGLLLAPPLLILAVVVAVPFLAISAVVAAVALAIVVPIALARRVRAHHREHGSTMFIHHFRR